MFPIRLFSSKAGYLVFLLVFSFGYFSEAQIKPADADSFFNFINANRTRASVYITINDTVHARLNETKLMPLAGTSKLLAAVELAQQSAHEMINENQYVALSDVEKFYLPYIDSATHQAWKTYAEKNNLIKNGMVKLVEVARGMMMFNSYANADYIMDILGFDNVKDNIALFKLKQHTAIFPYAGSMFSYQIPRKSSEAKLIKALSKYSDKKYSMEAYYNHLDLKEDSTFKESFNPEQFTPTLQKMWTDNLPKSTTKEYIEIAQTLNNRQVLEEDAFFTISEVVEFPMETPSYQRRFKHYGEKGSSSPYVLTHVFYCTLKDGTRLESAIFFNDLSPAEVKKLEGWQPSFNEQLIFDPVFRNKVRF
ncbi:MAG: hypothetical protein IPL84_11755 [Chitinophagaceae bacterium]|nr:hypothetical protein [Chitinophagaceae bacterium]